MDKIKITDIVPADYNPRKISDEDYNRLSNSIMEFGFVDPIIINLKNNRIIGGHQRYNVLVEEYMQSQEDELLLIKLGDIGWVFPSDKLNVESESHEKALNIALNKISGQWDNEKLQELIIDLEVDDVDLSLTGFSEYEIDKFKYDADVEFEDIDEDMNRDYDVVDTSEEQNVEKDCITCPFCEQQFKEEDAI